MRSTQEIAGPPSVSAASRAITRELWQTAGVGVFLLALTWLVFGRTLGHEFVNYDDGEYVYANPAIAHGLTLHGAGWVFTHVHGGNWHPVTGISHLLDCQLFGLDPRGHHLTNVLLHTATVLLLFLVLRQMTGALWRSAVVAVLFAIHPLRVESVAWIAERKDVLSGFFFMLTLWAYGHYTRSSRRQEAQTLEPTLEPPHVGCYRSKAFWYVTLLGFFALGLLSKPMLVTTPFVLLLLDYWPLKRVSGAEGQGSGVNTPVTFHVSRFTPHVSRFTFQQLVREKIPLLALSAAACVITLLAQANAHAIRSFEQVSLAARFGNALISYATYLHQMFWPADLAVLYPFDAGNVTISRVLLSLMLLAGISAVAFFGRRRFPCLVTGWLWYLVMLVPVIGIVQVGFQAHADRYTYLPQIGLYVMLTWAVADLLIRLPGRRLVLSGGAAVILALLLVRARAQVAFWRDSESLWTHTLACTTANPIAHHSLGDALFQKGNVDEAIIQFHRVLELRPDDAEACTSLGSALLRQGRVDDAIAHHQKALALKPDYAVAHNNLGNALLRKGGVEEAIVHFRTAVELKPDNANAHNNLANALLQTGATDEGIAHYRTALRLNPDDAVAHNNLGNALLHTGNAAEAMACYRQALRIRPDYALAHKNLGYALLQTGSVDESIAEYQRALQLRPDDASVCNDLGEAFLQQGKVSQAMSCYRKALQIRPEYPEVQNNLAWLLATSPEASLRDGREALELARRANQFCAGQNPIVLHTLAAACAEAGQFADAVQNVQRAMELAQSAGQQELLEQLKSELKLYEAQRPFRQDGQ